MSAPSSSSPSRAEELLREAIELEATELYLQADGEKARVRYRVSGRIVQKLDGFVPAAQEVFDELKALPTQQVLADENEMMGYFSFPQQDRVHWIRLYWFREEEEEAIVLSILERRLSFDELGLSPREAATLDELISLPQGVIIGCGKSGAGHATTLTALLERLVQNGKRVVLLTESHDPLLEKVTQLSIKDNELSEQMELLAGHFDAFAIADANSDEKLRFAFDLAKDGHLILALRHTPFVGVALQDFLNSGIAPDDLHTHFLGGWSQTLVPRADQPEHTGLFYCLSHEEAQQQLSKRATTDAIIDAEKKALQRDAEEKIAAGLITREETERVIQSS